MKAPVGVNGKALAVCFLWRSKQASTVRIPLRPEGTGLGGPRGVYCGAMAGRRLPYIPGELQFITSSLSLRENADPTRQASAPAVSSQKQMKQVLRCAQDDRVESALINNILMAMARKPFYGLM